MEELDGAAIEDSLPAGVGSAGEEASKKAAECASTSQPQRTPFREKYI